MEAGRGDDIDIAGYGDIGIGVSGLSHTQINMERKFSTGLQPQPAAAAHLEWWYQASERWRHVRLARVQRAVLGDCRNLKDERMGRPQDRLVAKR